VIAKSDENGYLYLNEEYQPYGEKIYGTEDFFGAGEDWYTGKNYSEELDLTYFGARWYDAKQGRFLSMDPVPVEIDSPHTFNRHVYAKNNPYSYIDPDGENAVTAFGGLITETGKFVTGKGFDSAAVYGALLDGYDGQGAGVAASAFQDATAIFSVTKIPGLIVKGHRLLGNSIGSKGLNPTAKQLDKFRKQLQEHGSKSLERSQRTIQRRLNEHTEKLRTIKKEGGHTSSVEREIRNFKRELEAIQRTLGEGS